jgi:DNA primase
MTSIVEQIKERLDIVDVISSYIKVEKAGINWKAKCPFHNEKTPSFFISQTRQNFFCFGCHEKGDVISFVEKYEGLDFKGALENLANRAGIEIKKQDYKRTIENRDRLFEAMEQATISFENNLKKETRIRKYLESRGLDAKTIKEWRLGYANDEWRTLLTNLESKGFTKKELLNVGLIKKVLNEEKYYDTFRGRIMFPIFDNANRVIAFSGRTLKKDANTPKYLNSPETSLFYKSEVLYGFNIAKNYIRKLDYTVLVEGQMDLIMSHKSGVHNTVASSGTALTEIHLKKLQRLSNRIIIAFDADKAGEKAGEGAALMATALGMEVKIAILKEGEDPASLIHTDSESWKKALRESYFYGEHVLNKANSMENENLTMKYIFSNVLPFAAKIKSEIEKEKYIKKIALKLRVSEDNVWRDLTKLVNNEGNTEKEYTIKNENNVSNLERIAVGLILLEESNHKDTTKLRTELQKILGNDRANEIISKYEDEKDFLIFELENYNDFQNFNNISKEVIQRLELNFLKSETRKFAIEMDKKNISEVEYKKIEKEFNRIQNRIRELKN